MLQRIQASALSLTLAFAAAFAPVTAHAWPFGKVLHLHPAQAQEDDGRITFQLNNKGGLVQDVRVAGRVYTVMPHSGLRITAPEGTEIYAASKGFGHRKGDVLFTVTPKMKYGTVSID